MKENVIIRNERKEDWEIVETITRQAFYNLHVLAYCELSNVLHIPVHKDYRRLVL